MALAMGLLAAILPTLGENTMKHQKLMQRAAWMVAYENAIYDRFPEAKRGRICWDTAAYLLSTGKSALEAAKTVSKPFREF